MSTLPPQKFYKEETPKIMQTKFIINHPETRLIKGNEEHEETEVEKTGISPNYLATYRAWLKPWICLVQERVSTVLNC